MAQQPRHSGKVFHQEKCVLWKIHNYAQFWENLEQEPPGLVGEPFWFTVVDHCPPGGTTTERPVISACSPIINNPTDGEAKTASGLLTIQCIPPRLNKAQARIQIQIAGEYPSRFGYEDGTLRELGKEPRLLFPLPPPADEPQLSADGALELKIAITIYHSTDSENAELVALEAKYKDRFARGQLRVLSSICDKPDFSNREIKIVSKDDVLSINLAYLSQSPVLAAMFVSGMREEKTGEINLEDFDSKPLEVFLHFLRTGKLSPNWKGDGIIDVLTILADKYNLPDLKRFLEQAMGLVCTKENCGKLAGLAQAFGFKKAEERIMAFFKENLASELEEVRKFSLDSEMVLALLTDEPVVEKLESGEGSPSKKPRLD